jgi:hypothetical protein
MRVFQDRPKLLPIVFPVDHSIIVTFDAMYIIVKFIFLFVFGLYLLDVSQSIQRRMIVLSENNKY